MTSAEVKADECLLVFCTCSSSEEAQQIANALIKKKAAACCNMISGIRSLYIWQGETQDEQEILLLIKTTRSAFPSAQKIMTNLHSDDVPEIIAVPIVAGADNYLQWIQKQTSSDQE